MQLRMTKGVGLAFALAAGCAVLGVIMAPGWYAFAAFSAWWGFVMFAGGEPDKGPITPSTGSDVDWEPDRVINPSYKDVHPDNVHRDWT